MNESLIGEEVTLAARAGEQLVQLLLAAAAAFLRAADAEPSDLSGTERRLRSALTDLAPSDAPGLVARLVFVPEGLEIHLRQAADPASDIIVSCPA